MREPRVTSKTLARARELRRNTTNSEARLWSALRNRQAGGFRWRRQHPFGPFILDFYCPEVRVAVEVDGGVHDSEDQDRHDARRDYYLLEHDVKVLRVPAHAVGDRLTRVVEWIVSRCEARRPSPPAAGAATSPLRREENV